MAWNTITYACGHTEEQQLYGKMEARDRTIAAAAGHDCPACRAAEAAAQDAANNLPALVGSEKQIGWASECRAKLLPLLDAEAARGAGLMARIEAGDFPAGTPAEKVAAARAEIDRSLAKIAAVKANSKAGYWIENRATPVRAMIAEAR